MCMWDFKRWGGKTAFITEDGFKISYSEQEQRQSYISCIQNHMVPVLLFGLSTKLDFESILQRFAPEFLWIPNELSIYQ